MTPARPGLARSFHICAIFPHLSVLQNIRVALQRPNHLATQFWLPLALHLTGNWVSAYPAAIMAAQYSACSLGAISDLFNDTALACASLMIVRLGVRILKTRSTKGGTFLKNGASDNPAHLLSASVWCQ